MDKMGMPGGSWQMRGHSQDGQSPLTGLPGMGPGGPQMQTHPGHLIHRPPAHTIHHLPAHMMHPPPAQMIHPPAQNMQMISQDQSELDSISMAKLLMPNLRESLAAVLEHASEAFSANRRVDRGRGSKSAVQLDGPSRFDKSFEEFFSVCDQMEMQLKTSVECVKQEMRAGRYLSTPACATETDNTLSYSQHVSNVQNQIAYTKSLQDIVTEGSQNMTNLENWTMDPASG